MSDLVKLKLVRLVVVELVRITIEYRHSDVDQVVVDCEVSG